MTTNNFIKKCFSAGMALIVFTIPFLAIAEDESDPNILGLALQSGSSYLGSNSNKISIVPIIMLANGPWFAQTTEGILETGFQQDFLKNYTIGIQLAYEDSRLQRDSSFLKQHNIGDIKASASYGAFLQYNNNLFQIIPIDLLVRYRKDINSARGSQLDLRLTTGVYGGEAKRLNVEAFAQTTYANQNSSQYYYGISQEQSLISTLNPYVNKSGFLSSQIGFWASYDVTTNWLLVGDIEVTRLQGDARNSPIVRNRTNNSALIGLAYKY